MTNFSKMAPIWVRFSPGLLKEQDFPESNLITFVAELIAPA
jgi:hypothetical protein